MSTTLTADEEALILQLRKWKDGIPDGALGQGKLSMTYLSCMAARAELYIMALRYGHNDLMERYERFHKMVSPHDIVKLVSTWEKYQHRLRDDESTEMMGDAAA
jgi:hypothetical protein